MLDTRHLLVAGVTVGCVYALIALSFAPAYSSSNIVNFGQGELVMLGNVFGAFLIGEQGWPYFPTLIPVTVVTGLVSVAMYLGPVRVIRGRGGGLITIVLGTLAAGILVRVAVSFLWGLEPRGFPGPFSDTPRNLLGLRVAPQSLVIVLGVVVILVGAYLVYSRTIAGLMVRATAFSRDTSQVVGVNVERVTIVAFFASGALAGLAGALYGPLVSANPNSGLQFALWGFTALIVGGLGSWAGPVIAGVLLGVLQTLANSWLGSGYGDTLALGLLVVFLYARPKGLLGHADLASHTA